MLFLAFNLYLNSQTWTYEKGGNVFDGEYKTSSIIGIGSEWPYEIPIFVVNVFNNNIDNPNIYLSNVTYAGCDNKQIKIIFDNESKVYNFTATTNENQDIWFLHLIIYEDVNIGYYDQDRKEWITRNSPYYKPQSKFDKNEFDNFIKDIKNRTKMHVRLQSDCTKYDCVFSLKGSTAALNFVFKK